VLISKSFQEKNISSHLAEYSSYLIW